MTQLARAAPAARAAPRRSSRAVELGSAKARTSRAVPTRMIRGLSRSRVGMLRFAHLTWLIAANRIGIRA
jgi:hypothetical protein